MFLLTFYLERNMEQRNIVDSVARWENFLGRKDRIQYDVRLGQVAGEKETYSNDDFLWGCR